MKALLLFLALSLPISTAFAQITVTAETLPAAGDTLRMRTDGLATGIVVSPPGADQEWDYRGLQSPVVEETVIRAASEGSFASGFPTASMFVELEAGVETYWRQSDGSIVNLGYGGTAPIDLGVPVIANVEPPLIERRTPLNYFDIFQSEAGVQIAVAGDDIPSEILNNFPIVPDSVRLRIAVDRLEVVDAWGTVLIPGNNYDVIREKRTEQRDVRIDVKIGFLDWQDITDLLPENFMLGGDTTVVYNFYSNEATEPIVTITTEADEQTIRSVQYKAEDVTTATPTLTTDETGVYAYPNPTMGETLFSFNNLPSGQYQLRLYNLLGVEQWSRDVFIRGNRSEKIDFSGYRKGTYLYSLVDERGKTLLTRRIVVVRP